jgi:hypothetical protein
MADDGDKDTAPTKTKADKKEEFPDSAAFVSSSRADFKAGRGFSLHILNRCA